VFVFLLVAITASGLYSVDAAHVMRGLYGSMGEIQREQDSLLEDHSRLMLERGALTSMQNIEEVAASELGMQFPDQVGQVLR
jgi:cell division protein FtsL